MKWPITSAKYCMLCGLAQRCGQWRMNCVNNPAAATRAHGNGIVSLPAWKAPFESCPSRRSEASRILQQEPLHVGCTEQTDRDNKSGKLSANSGKLRPKAFLSQDLAGFITKSLCILRISATGKHLGICHSFSHRGTIGGKVKF